MAHLSTGSCHVTCACQGVSPFGSTQSRWPIFRLVHVIMSCQGVSPFGSSQSRWHIFRLVHVIMSCHMCLSRCLTFRGSSQSRWHIFRLVHVMSHVLVKVSHLSAAPSQDGTSFDWFMSSCHVTCTCQGVSPFTQSRWHIYLLYFHVS